MIHHSVTLGSDVLRSRRAGDFVDMVSGYSSSVYLEVDNRRINAKSIIGVLSLNLEAGDKVELLCNGEDEERAGQEIMNYMVK